METISFRKAEDKNHPYVIELYSSTSDSVTICKVESGAPHPKSTHGTIKLAVESEKAMNDWLEAME